MSSNLNIFLLFSVSRGNIFSKIAVIISAVVSELGTTASSQAPLSFVLEEQEIRKNGV